VIGVTLLAFSHDSGVTVAEVAFLFLLMAGAWIAVAWIMENDRDLPKWRRFRMIAAGVLIAGSGLLLIIATQWGHLFS
jgi:hypothetical protein